MTSKKSSSILYEGNRLEAYLFIQKHCKKFGLRWLLRKFHICPNAYYNYLKNRKADYLKKKMAIKASIQEIYHSHDGGGWISDHSFLSASQRNFCKLPDSTQIHEYRNAAVFYFKEKKTGL